MWRYLNTQLKPPNFSGLKNKTQKKKFRNGQCTCGKEEEALVLKSPCSRSHGIYLEDI